LRAELTSLCELREVRTFILFVERAELTSPRGALKYQFVRLQKETGGPTSSAFLNNFLEFPSFPASLRSVIVNGYFTLPVQLAG
jgi:hypothetical protein